MSETAQEQATEGASPPSNGAAEGEHNYEAEARALGWRPKELWRGPPSRWVDAETFMHRSQEWLPQVQQRNQEMSRDLQAAKSEISELRDIMAQQLERQRRAEQIGYKRAMRELEQRKAEAISNADAAEVARVDQEMRDMGPAPSDEKPPPRTAAPAPQSQQADPVVVDWVQRNPWVTADPTAWDMAVSTLNRVQAAGPGAPLVDQLAEVERRIKKLFVQPDDAAPAPRERRADPPAVARSSGSQGTRSGAPKPRSFEAMPSNVQAQYEKEKRAVAGKGTELTRAEFAEYYWEQFPEDE